MSIPELSKGLRRFNAWREGEIARRCTRLGPGQSASGRGFNDPDIVLVLQAGSRITFTAACVASMAVNAERGAVAAFHVIHGPGDVTQMPGQSGLAIGRKRGALVVDFLPRSGSASMREILTTSWIANSEDV